MELEELFQVFLYVSALRKCMNHTAEGVCGIGNNLTVVEELVYMLNS